MYDKFLAYLNDLEKSFEALSGLLTQKLVALDRFDLEKLDNILKEEQVYVLQTKGFDNNIKMYREKLGFSGDRLSQIIGELPGAEQQRFDDALKQLTAALEKVKALNEKCQGLTESRLSALDKAIKELDRSTGANYGETRPPADAPMLMNKSI